MRMKRMSVSKCIPKGNRKRSSNFLFIFTGPFNKSFGQHWLTRTLTFMPIFWHSTIFSQSRTASEFLLFILVWIGIRIAFTQMYAGHVYTGYADKYERRNVEKRRETTTICESRFILLIDSLCRHTSERRHIETQCIRPTARNLDDTKYEDGIIVYSGVFATLSAIARYCLSKLIHI